MRDLGPIWLAALLCAACGNDATLYVSDVEGALDGFSAQDARGARDTAGDTPMVRDTGRGGPATDTSAGDVADVDAGEGDDTAPSGAGCADIDTTLAFEERILGRSHQEEIILKSCADFDGDDLRISEVGFVNDGDVTSAPEFSLTADATTPIVVLPNDRLRLTVVYVPTEAGEHSAVLRLVTNDPERATIDIVITASAS